MDRKKYESFEGLIMQVNVGADKVFKNNKDMERFFKKTFDKKEVKIKYDTKKRMKKYESGRWPIKPKN